MPCGGSVSVEQGAEIFMSDDTLCVGVCMVDPDTGVCLGCGRTPEEISGVPQPVAPTPAPKAAPLPTAVQAEVVRNSSGEG